MLPRLDRGMNWQTVWGGIARIRSGLGVLLVLAGGVRMARAQACVDMDVADVAGLCTVPYYFDSETSRYITLQDDVINETGVRAGNFSELDKADGHYHDLETCT